MKSAALKSAFAALALTLLLPLAQGAAEAKPSSPGSFKSGFSSQRSAPAPSKGSFGSFNKRSSSSSSSATSAPRNGGFGSFGKAAPADARKSDSALSRKLEREAAEARALRTLDERRAAQAARNAPPPPADYGQAPRQRYDNGAPSGYGQAQPPVIVRQNSGLGHVIAGAVIANAAANAHAQRNHEQSGATQPAPLPAPTWNGGVDSVNGGSGSVQPVPAPAHAAAPRAGGGSVFGTIFTLALMAAIGWGIYKLLMRRRRGAAAKKQNYSFERN